jgi:hypothetical protein
MAPMARSLVAVTLHPLRAYRAEASVLHVNEYRRRTEILRSPNEIGLQHVAPSARRQISCGATEWDGCPRRGAPI